MMCERQRAVRRTPSSAPDPLVRLVVLLGGRGELADEGVGRGPGGPPHKADNL
jgi:hypothetical protein